MPVQPDLPSLTFSPATEDARIEIIASLARKIWYEHYVPLIGRPQVDYMVGKFQSVAAMLEQLRSGYEYFLVQRGDIPIGYLSIQVQSGNVMFVSKLYVLRDCRGSGTGKAIMAFIEDLACRRGIDKLWLTVNKGNPAVNFYARLGFRNVASIVVDIGQGFVMDDFRMEKVLRS